MKYWLKSAIAIAYSLLFISVNQIPTAKVNVNPVTTGDIYRRLADLLLQKNRIEEARQIIELLKVQEIEDFTRKYVEQETATNILTSYRSEVFTPVNSIVSLTKEIKKCEKINCPQKSQLNDKLTELVNEFNQELEKIEPEINERIARDRSTFRPDSPKAMEIVKAQPNTVIDLPLSTGK
ncbi:MAG: hypothetical protein HC908_16565 [Calothrix sp. SM1_7_51]|nr:hypothetical protein [Calothrix sp. SM1_7_51]